MPSSSCFWVPEEHSRRWGQTFPFPSPPVWWKLGVGATEPGLGVKFLAAVWVGKATALRSAVTDEGRLSQALLRLQELQRVSGYPKTGTRGEQEALQGAQAAVPQTQALGAFDPSLPAELNVHQLSTGSAGACGSAKIPPESPLGSGVRFVTEQKKGRAQLTEVTGCLLCTTGSRADTQTAEGAVKPILPI